MITNNNSMKNFPEKKNIHRSSFRTFPTGSTSTALKILNVSGLLLLPFIVLLAFSRNDDTSGEINIFLGFCFALFLFVITYIFLRQDRKALEVWSYTSFSNSKKKNSTFWKLIKSLSVFYLVFLGFVLFQSRKHVINVLVWYWPYLKIERSMYDKEYGGTCEITWARIKSHVYDYFFVAHFLGWAIKAPIARDCGILWVLSVAWEITEIFTTNIYPLLDECWWDALFIDILLCNAAGIFLGMAACKLFKVKTLSWNNVVSPTDKNNKIKKLSTQKVIGKNQVSQFPYTTIIGFYLLVCIWQISEMNTMLMREAIKLTLGHPVTIIRVTIVGLSAIPAVSQWHAYCTDPKCKRIGTSMYIFLAIIMTELLAILKFGIINLINWNNFMWPIYWAIFMVPYSAVSYFTISKFKNIGGQTCDDH